MRNLITFFHPKLPIYLTYMLQQVDYQPNDFLRWVVRLPNLTKVIHRKNLVLTLKAKALVIYTYFLWISYIILSLYATLNESAIELIYLIVLPFWVVLILYFTVFLAWTLIELPRRNRLIVHSASLFANHSATKIAIAGSFGKTTLKELLATVLGEAKKVAITPGNKNVPISHARWINSLKGDEQILVIEYGEGAPGDVARFAQTTHPDIGVITGLAPNHLDRYKNLESVACDLFSLADYLGDKPIYVNSSSSSIKKYLKKNYKTYDDSGVDGWEVSNIKIDISGTKFLLRKDKITIKISSALLGRHQVGPLSLVAVLAHQLGLAIDEVELNIAKTEPFEHRMNPRSLGGAWIIDDTYNGSLEGFRAGLELLGELKSKRKIYVTPGLVDQGKEAPRVHREIGELVARANPQKTILMQNSATKYIEDGLKTAGYQGVLEIREDPLDFYTNMDQYVAAGDIWLLQNDWTDNYN